MFPPVSNRYHQAGAASGSGSADAAALAAYVNLSAAVTVTELPVSAVSESAVHVSVHASAPVGSNASPSECDTHVLALVHTSESMAKVISAVRGSVVAVTEQVCILCILLCSYMY